MSHSNPDDLLLLIRCPSCGQRFKVGEDLRERTVECGGCEHRFRIEDDVIVRGRKFYPGERSNPALDRFQRVPLAGGESLIGVRPIRQSHTQDPAVLDPVSPQRIIAGIVGVTAMIIMALLLMFGASGGGLLDGMVLSNRLLAAGFASVLGILMLLYANPKGRVKALAVGILLACGVMAVPFFFTAGSVQPPHDAVNPKAENGLGSGHLSGEPAEDKTMTDLKARIGTGPLIAEIDRLAAVGGNKRAVGLWIRGLNGSNRYLVQDYVIRATHADFSSHFYPRDDGDFLFVVTGITQTLEELADIVALIGKTEKIFPQLSVIEVSVRNEIFVEGPIEKLSKKDGEEFYELNKRELDSIDLERIKRAVQRLAEAEPKIYRIDITRRLIALLLDDGVDFKKNICRALAVWSEKPGPASEAALRVVKKMRADNDLVPTEIVDLIVKEKNVEVIPILDELWFKDSMIWETIYGNFGRPVEATLIRRLPTVTGIVRYSAIRLLGRVGGADSLPALAAVAPGNDPELKVLLGQARKSIEVRLGQ
jgi:hypothetical protein